MENRLALCAATLGALVLWAALASIVLALQLHHPLEGVRPWDVLLEFRRVGWSEPLSRSAFLSALLAGAGLFALFNRTVTSDFGNARFARAFEVHRAKLLQASGVLLGRYRGRYLRNGEPVHVLVAAPPRSGKGTGIVVPNLLSWPGSAVVMDIKYENHQITSGYRAAQGQAVYRFSPADPGACSHRYNPLDAVRPGLAHRVSDLQSLAAILVPVPKGGKDSFWQDEGRSLFLGLALYVLDTPKIPHTLGEIFRTLMSPQPLEEVIRHILRTRSDLDPVCISNLGSFVNKADKERSGVRSTLTAALNLFANPVIDAATSATDFDLRDLRRKPMTIYVAVSMDQLSAVAKLLNLFFQQALLLMSESLPGKDEPYKVLFMLDEFASLGRMDILKDSLAFLAGYNIRICTILQGLAQLDDLYGRAGREAILQSSALQVVYAANDETTPAYISKRLGTRTIRTMSKSLPMSGGRGGSKSYSYAGRALMLPEEVCQLGAREALVLKEGARAVRARKIRYYEERAFRERLLPQAPVPELLLQPGIPPQFPSPSQASSPRASAPGPQVAEFEEPDGPEDMDEAQPAA